jgi:signal transduction histidine kinase
MSLGAIQATVVGQPAAAAAVQSARLELRVPLDKLRALAHGLYHAVLTQSGIGPAIQAVAERLPLDIQDQVARQHWHPVVESTAYLFACEALANAVTHAGRCTAHVVVSPADGDLVVTVDDDGDGFLVEEQVDAVGGLRDRLGALGGNLFVSSLPGKGAHVEARISSPGAPT